MGFRRQSPREQGVEQPGISACAVSFEGRCFPLAAGVRADCGFGLGTRALACGCFAVLHREPGRWW